MNFHAVLTRDLAALAALAVSVPGSADALPAHYGDLTDSLTSLHDAVALTASSLLGLSITMTIQGQDVILTSMDDQDPVTAISSSLLVPLSALSIPGAGTVLFYASTRGALVDLAADLTHALHLDHDALLLDQHLSPRPVSGLTGVRELSVVNMGLGILIEQGHTLDDAERELRRRAARSELELHEAAARLITRATASSS